ncbi:MAG TPA: creatininase family protein, partial [Acidimicrobiales bacterium]|nr:creatininase family protein [Acidimicrobiales bacterium]
QPIGAIEQHGPHLPLATDALVAEAAAAEVVQRHGAQHDLWLLPCLSYGKSTEHEWAPGTISLSTASLLGVLDDLGRCVARLPARRLAFVNAHGGNVPLLGVALRDLRRHHGLYTFLLNALPPPAYGPSAPSGDAGEVGMGIHAGRDETSLVLHLRPDLVDLSTLEGVAPRPLPEFEHARFGGDTAFGWLSDDLAGEGIIGDPAGASAERGAALLESITVRLAAALAEAGRFAFGS